MMGEEIEPGWFEELKVIDIRYMYMNMHTAAEPFDDIIERLWNKILARALST